MFVRLLLSSHFFTNPENVVLLCGPRLQPGPETLKSGSHPSYTGRFWKYRFPAYTLRDSELPFILPFWFFASQVLLWMTIGHRNHWPISWYLQIFHSKSTTVLPLIKCKAIITHVHSFQDHFDDEPQTTPASPTCLSSRQEFPTPRPCPSGWAPRTSSTWQNSAPHSSPLYKPASPVSTPHLI